MIARRDPKEASAGVRRLMNFVKSKQRVADHGEVFTPPWMVEAMLDLKLNKEKIDYIESMIRPMNLENGDDD